MEISIEFKPQDLWIGAYWRRRAIQGHVEYTVWVCLLPCLPIVISWERDP